MEGKMKLTRIWVIGLAAMPAWVNLAASQERTKRPAASRLPAGISIMFIQGLIICLLPTLAGAQEHAVLPRGHVFFATDFEGGEALKGWSGPGVLDEGFHGGHALVVERPADKGPGYTTATIALPVEKMRGYVVQFSARIKAQNVSRKPQPWNGVKFMAAVVTDHENTWPAAELPKGTFDWQKVAFRAIIPDDAKQVTLVVGLESVTGKAWFDDIRVVAWKPLAIAGPQVTASTAYKGHNLPRLRGAMVSPSIDAEGLRVLGQQWNANLVRWQLIRTEKFDDGLDLAAYDRWLQSALKRLDAALPLCEKYGLRVVVDLHSPPGGHRLSGGYAGSDHGLFNDAACQRKFIEVWQHMARRYKDSKAIWGYDLANEPVEAATGEELADWQDMAEQAAKAIRAIDPERAIIVEPPEWGSPLGLRELRPLAVPGIVYSVHMYLPHAFTHQGVFGASKAYRYPGEIDGKRWDKAQLEAALKPVVEFQQKYNVHIYIGEFSAIRWAPDGSACRYLKDLIDIFESHGWDWSYHAFREWDGWSVEHGADPEDHGRAKSPTDREQLLRSWFAQNLKPAGKPAAVPPAATYRDGWPAAKYRLDAQDHGVVLRHGDGPGRCDILGARDVWLFEPANQTWFLFTNHVGLDGFEYTDAVWAYWSKDLNRWDPAHKAVVLDRSNCSWSKHIIGLPSVVRVGDRLALFYDGNGDTKKPAGVKSHTNRDIGLAWLRLPLVRPAEAR